MGTRIGAKTPAKIAHWRGASEIGRYLEQRKQTLSGAQDEDSKEAGTIGAVTGPLDGPRLPPKGGAAWRQADHSQEGSCLT